MRGVAEKGVTHVTGIFPSDEPGSVEGVSITRTQLLKDKQGSLVEERSELCLLVGLYLQVDGRIREAVSSLRSCVSRGRS
jgi:hypothetical protein